MFVGIHGVAVGRKGGVACTVKVGRCGGTVGSCGFWIHKFLWGMTFLYFLVDLVRNFLLNFPTPYIPGFTKGATALISVATQ